MVFLEECRALGQVTAYLIKNSDAHLVSETPVLSIWLDSLGNIKTPEPTSSGFLHSNDDNALSTFVINLLTKTISSSEFQPLKNG